MQLTLALCAAVLAAVAGGPRWAEAIARTIKVSLARGITQEAGEFGQPIVSYYAPVAIGTPPKLFNIQFDVALSELFVPHYEWNPFKRYLHYSSGFQCKVSSTCQKDERQQVTEYEGCRLTGKRYEDWMQLPTGRPYNGAGAVAPSGAGNASAIKWRQNFLAISDASTDRFKSLPVDGYFGLSPAQQSPAALSNILLTLHKAQLIDNLQFAFWFNPVLDSAAGGELILGGYDPARFQGQIYWHHLDSVQANQWSLGLQFVSLGQQVFSCAGQQCRARLSTGSSDIYGPREDVQRLYALLNTSKEKNGLQLIDCRRIASLPLLTFNVDGVPYALYPSNYIRKTVDGVLFKSETCYVSVLPSDERRQWTLGSNFLGAYYSMFDLTYRQMGFAALR